MKLLPGIKVEQHNNDFLLIGTTIDRAQSLVFKEQNPEVELLGWRRVARLPETEGDRR